MSNDADFRDRPVRPTAPEPVRRSVKLAVVLAIVFGAGVVFYSIWTGKRTPVAAVEQPAASVETDLSGNEEPVEVLDSAKTETVPPSEIANTAATRAVPVSRTPKVEPSAEVRQLVSNLTGINFGSKLTDEQASKWKQGLSQLLAQGKEAVPGIREFLEQNRDWDFGSGSGLGYPTLRSAFLDTLQQIGGPEAQELMLQTLQSTSVPSEVARLAGYLELQEPGRFRNEINQAATEALAQAGVGEMRGWDTGPLFQVLKTYGDASVAQELERNASKWNYYSTLTLANLPSGEGIPSLVRLAQDPGSGSAKSAALEMLAESAFQYPQASSALLDLARSSKIPERSWTLLAAALSGDQHFIRDTGSVAAVPVGQGVRAYHLEASNQNFYTVPAGGMSAEQANTRIAIIDQLLTVRLGQSAEQALQNARSLLVTKGEQVRGN